MLLGFVIPYLLISIGIGVYAATRVKSSRDYVVAGRSLPIYIVTATVFATWFGSETVLGISATFLQEGLHGIVSDPFGSSLCPDLRRLVFCALAVPHESAHHRRFLPQEIWPRCRNCGQHRHCAFLYGLGIGADDRAGAGIFNVLSDGAITRMQGTLIGAAIVLLYTLFGGMWSVALTDFFQMIIIVVGLFYIGWVVSGMVGGVGTVVSHAQASGKLSFWPAGYARDIVAFVVAWVTMMLGSIPQQDVFQRA